MIDQPTREEIEKARAVMSGVELGEALTRLCLVLFNLNEFVYVD